MDNPYQPKGGENIHRDTFFYFSASLLGLVLIGLGVFLLATGFPLIYINIGVIVTGNLLLILGGFGKCLKIPDVTCLLLILITQFLIITGILAILAGQLVVGLILIGLGILALVLNASCLILNMTMKHLRLNRQ